MSDGAKYQLLTTKIASATDTAIKINEISKQNQSPGIDALLSQEIVIGKDFNINDYKEWSKMFEEPFL